MRIKRAFVRFHLWIGEKLGLTHYRNCHTCGHCDKASEPSLVWCDLYMDEDGVLVATDPSEAVWCDEYIEKFGKKSND